MIKKIIFSTGGTGGHIFPAINLMKHFFDKGYKVLIVTDKRGYNFLKDYPEFKSYILTTSTPTNKNILIKIMSYFIIFFSIVKSIFILKKEKPNLIFGFGGYVSFPISFASKLFKLPLAIYENNVVLGRTNRYLSRYSDKIFTAKELTSNLPKKYESKVYQVGSVLSKKIINHSLINQDTDKNFFSILVLGGSQGAEIFGRVIPPVIKMIKQKGHQVKIKQQCISKQKKGIIDYYKKNNIKSNVFEFDKNILELILSSNLAITRCGASTTAELVHACTPFIAVPLPNSIDNHQYLNGKYYEKKGYCWLLKEENFSTENLFNLIIESINNKQKLENARINMKKNYSSDVYGKIEKEINTLV